MNIIQYWIFTKKKVTVVDVVVEPNVLPVEPNPPKPPVVVVVGCEPNRLVDGVDEPNVFV